MNAPNYRTTRISLGLTLMVLVAIGTGVLSMDNGSWKKLGDSRLAVFSVGLTDYQCCKKSEKTPCADSPEWQCGNPPISCTSGDPTYDSCADSSCITTTNEHDHCGGTSDTIYKNVCRGTGNKTTAGCSGNQERCTYDTSSSREVATFDRCSTGSTLCSSGQPANSCE